MACMKFGSKEDVFRLEGRSWLCTSGPCSDVCIEIGETHFHLHRFCLLPQSRLLERCIQGSSRNNNNNEDIKCVISLHDLPGGAEAFLLVAKFCYGAKFELTAADVVYLRCAAEYLEMTEDYGEVNLISWTEDCLDEVLTNWVDTIKALETCETVLPLSEELHIISRCIDSLADKICSDPTLVNWPILGHSASQNLDSSLLNDLHSSSKRYASLWHEDVSFLKLPLFKRLMQVVASKGLTSNRIAESVMFYARRHLPITGRQSCVHKRNPRSTLSVTSISDQKTLVEEIIGLLPKQKGTTPTEFLLKLLKTSMILDASKSCRETLERRIGAQLEQAVVQDLLIPNAGSSMETLYDVECVQRVVDNFLLVDQDDTFPNAEEDKLLEGSSLVTSVEMVANLLDSYLAEVAPDANLKLEKFMVLAASIPEYARPLDDGIYHAIDVYMEAHPWLTDSEREQLCQMIDCQKLSLEASTHAAQNKRLPLRFIAQVLFFEQLRLRTSVAGWLYVSDNIEASQNLSKNIEPRNAPNVPASCSEGDQAPSIDEMKERVSELEKECENMKHDIEKLGKSKRGCNDVCRRICVKSKKSSCGFKSAFFPCYGGAV